jgi:hypothetical protein
MVFHNLSFEFFCLHLNTSSSAFVNAIFIPGYVLSELDKHFQIQVKGKLPCEDVSTVINDIFLQERVLIC